MSIKHLDKVEKELIYKDGYKDGASKPNELVAKQDAFLRNTTIAQITRRNFGMRLRKKYRKLFNN